MALSLSLSAPYAIRHYPISLLFRQDTAPPSLPSPPPPPPLSRGFTLRQKSRRPPPHFSRFTRPDRWKVREFCVGEISIGRCKRTEREKKKETTKRQETAYSSVSLEKWRERKPEQTAVPRRSHSGFFRHLTGVYLKNQSERADVALTDSGASILVEDINPFSLER